MTDCKLISPFGELVNMVALGYDDGSEELEVDHSMKLKT